MNLKSEEEIITERPEIIKSKSILVNFFSLDGVEDVFFQYDLYKIYPELYKIILDYSYHKKLTILNIFPFSKTKYDNIIINIPFKENFDDIIDLEAVVKNLEKMHSYKDKNFRNYSVYIQKEQLPEEIFKKIPNNNKYIYK